MTDHDCMNELQSAWNSWQQNEVGIPGTSMARLESKNARDSLNHKDFTSAFKKVHALITQLHLSDPLIPQHRSSLGIGGKVNANDRSTNMH